MYRASPSTEIGVGAHVRVDSNEDHTNKVPPVFPSFTLPITWDDRHVARGCKDITQVYVRCTGTCKFPFAASPFLGMSTHPQFIVSSLFYDGGTLHQRMGVRLASSSSACFATLTVGTAA